jgi:hypothetical protein
MAMVAQQKDIPLAVLRFAWQSSHCKGCQRSKATAYPSFLRKQESIGITLPSFLPKQA